MSGLSSMQRELLRLAHDAWYLDGTAIVRFDAACKIFFPEYQPEAQQWLMRESPVYRRFNSVRAAVSRSLKRLEQRGLIERARSRHVSYFLTLDGFMEAAGTIAAAAMVKSPQLTVEKGTPTAPEENYV